jgi:putative transposase
MLSQYELINTLTAENQVDYRALPAQTSQQIIFSLYKNIKGFFKALKIFKKMPSQFKGQPRFPNFKDKKFGRNPVILTGQFQCRLKDGYIYFPEKLNLQPLKTLVTKINQVRIIPKQSHFVFEVVFEREVKKHDLNKDFFISLDIGVDNLIAFISNLAERPVLLNGKMVKAENQYYNKKMAEFRSASPFRTTHRMERLSLKRENWIHNYFHQVSHFLIQYCIERKIGTIIVGYNKGWKQECNLGKKTNQKFVSIPFDKLLNQIEYKCEDNGINFLKTEESYTSKVDHLAGETLEKHDIYMGRRIKRGLFKSSTGALINADVNGALGISRKVFAKSQDYVFGNWHLMPEANRGFADNPVKCNIFTNNYKDKNQILSNR